MPKKMYEEYNRRLNKDASVLESLGISRKSTFDDGTQTERDPGFKDEGTQQNWPGHMQEHFSKQSEINKMMEHRMNRAVGTYDDQGNIVPDEDEEDK